MFTGLICLLSSSPICLSQATQCTEGLQGLHIIDDVDKPEPCDHSVADASPVATPKELNQEGADCGSSSNSLESWDAHREAKQDYFSLNRFRHGNDREEPPTSPSPFRTPRLPGLKKWPNSSLWDTGREELAKDYSKKAPPPKESEMKPPQVEEDTYHSSPLREYTMYHPPDDYFTSHNPSEALPDDDPFGWKAKMPKSPPAARVIIGFECPGHDTPDRPLKKRARSASLLAYVLDKELGKEVSEKQALLEEAGPVMMTPRRKRGVTTGHVPQAH